MAAHAARRLLPMAENLTQILAIELLAACQGCDFHAPLPSSAPLERVRSAGARRGPAPGRRPLPGARHRKAAADWCAPAPSSTAAGDRRCRRRGAVSDGNGIARAWLTVAAAATAPLIVSFPHTGTDIPPEIEARLRLAVAGAQGRRLVDRSAVRRDRPRAGRHHRPHRDLAHRHRRQPRSVGRLALSGPGRRPSWCRRPPSTASRCGTRGRRPTQRRSRGGAQATSTRTTPRSPPRVARLRAMHRPRRPVRLPLDPLGHPAPVRRRAAGHQHRHQLRRDLRSSAAGCRSTRIAAASDFSHVVNGRFKGGYITRALRRAGRRRARRADGARLPRLHARAARAGTRRRLADAVRPRLRRADPRHAARYSRSLPLRSPNEGTAMTRIDNARVIRAPRGTEISAKSWLTEAPLRMLMNNLDPEVAEKPARAGRLRRHRPRRARLGELRPHRRRAAQARGRRDAAGAVGQAGRRVPHARRRAARADRQLQPRAALGDAGSTSTSSIARA